MLFNNRQVIDPHEVLTRSRAQKAIDLLWAKKLLENPEVRELLGTKRLAQCQCEGIYSGMLLAKSVSNVICAYDPARMIEVERNEAKLKNEGELRSLKEALSLTSSANNTSASRSSVRWIQLAKSSCWRRYSTTIFPGRKALTLATVAVLTDKNPECDPNCQR